MRASLLRGTGPPSPIPANRLSCLSPIVEANSRTAVQDDEDDQPEVKFVIMLKSFLNGVLIPKPRWTSTLAHGMRMPWSWNWSV